jgi:hypothetical protein
MIKNFIKMFLRKNEVTDKDLLVSIYDRIDDLHFMEDCKLETLHEIKDVLKEILEEMVKP